MRILVAEDETAVAKALKVILERNHYAVDTVDNGKDALDYALSGNYDVIILDIMMPKMDGIQVLTELRKKKYTQPIMLLTAKSEIEDRVVGLNAGADDYLPKPFATTEFVARVKALGRRVSSFVPDVISLGNTALDCNTFTLAVEDREVRLNNKEFQMMEMFMRNQHNIFSADQLMERIWGYDSETEIDVIWAYIAFLRKKLKQLQANVEIQTIRGVGYALEMVEWKEN